RHRAKLQKRRADRGPTLQPLEVDLAARRQPEGVPDHRAAVAMPDQVIAAAAGFVAAQALEQLLASLIAGPLAVLARPVEQLLVLRQLRPRRQPLLHRAMKVAPALPPAGAFVPLRGGERAVDEED